MGAKPPRFTQRKKVSDDSSVCSFSRFGAAPGRSAPTNAVLRQIIQRWCVFLKIRAVAYAHDGYIKAKMSVALDVLSDLKRVLKEDAGLSLNFDRTQKSKTKFLVKGISAADAHAAALRRVAHCQFLP